MDCATRYNTGASCETPIALSDIKGTLLTILLRITNDRVSNGSQLSIIVHSCLCIGPHALVQGTHLLCKTVLPVQASAAAGQTGDGFGTSSC